MYDMNAGTGRGFTRASAPQIAIDGVVTGVVFNMTVDDRLPGATVVAQPPHGEPVVATTDASGHYRLELAPGVHELTIYYNEDRVGPLKIMVPQRPE